jgi:hypothetical protein
VPDSGASGNNGAKNEVRSTIIEIIVSVVFAVAGAFLWGVALAHLPRLDAITHVHFAPTSECILSSDDTSCVSSNSNVEVAVDLPNPNSSCNFSTSVNWGNGVAGSGGGVTGSNPGMVAIASYKYPKEGTYYVVVTVTAIGGCGNPYPIDYTFKYTQ